MSRYMWALLKWLWLNCLFKPNIHLIVFKYWCLCCYYKTLSRSSHNEGDMWMCRANVKTTAWSSTGVWQVSEQSECWLDCSRQHEVSPPEDFAVFWGVCSLGLCQTFPSLLCGEGGHELCQQEEWICIVFFFGSCCLWPLLRGIVWQCAWLL